MNAVFTKKGVGEVQMHYGDHVFLCTKTHGQVFLVEKGKIGGQIIGMDARMVMIETYGETPFVGHCLFTYQTSCLPWLVGLMYGKNKTLL